MMDKREFFDRTLLASNRARDFAASYLADELPTALCITIRAHNIAQGRQGTAGTIKFLGGRFLVPQEYTRIPWRDAARLFWVDGTVPAWINIGVYDYDETHTELEVHYCDTLLPADPYQLPADLGCERGNAMAPFRIRGPGPPENWRSVELDGCFPLRRPTEKMDP